MDGPSSLVVSKKKGMLLVVHELRAGAVYSYLGSPGLLYLVLCLRQGAPPRVGWGGGGSRRQSEEGGWAVMQYWRAWRQERQESRTILERTSRMELCGRCTG